MDKVLVCKADEGDKYFLRIHLSAGQGGVLRFDSDKAYSKCEADYRAVVISTKYGFGRDELPTHPQTMPYPKGESNV